MAPRANWNGYLKLSLVSCAVALDPATTTSNRIRFNIINKRTGHRVRNLVVDAESGQPVDEQYRVKSYKVDGDQYVLLEDEELDKIALESTQTIDIEAFVPLAEAPPEPAPGPSNVINLWMLCAAAFRPSGQLRRELARAPGPRRRASVRRRDAAA
jgi:DNA end-binding protein Ku